MEARQSKTVRLKGDKFDSSAGAGTSSGIIQDCLSSLRHVGLGVHERRVRRSESWKRARRGQEGNNPINVPLIGMEVEVATETNLTRLVVLRMHAHL